MLDTISALIGLVATLWISLGVYTAAKFYPNYNHIEQFCSELGAAGSPTEKLSPLINNYPLGVLFCWFGCYLLQVPDSGIGFKIIGVLVILHGIGTWVAGVFPMDKDPYTKQPSFQCKVHSWAGLIMLLSLLIAPIIAAFITDHLPTWFRGLSIFCVALSTYFLIKLADAYKRKKSAGLYQRLSYWIKLIWLSILSLILAPL